MKKRQRRRRKINTGRLAILLVCVAALAGLVLFAGYKGISALLAPKKTVEVQTEKETTEEEPRTDRVLVTAAGDILLEQTILDYFGNWSWNSYASAVSDLIGKDDLTIATLNGAVAGESYEVSGADGSFNAPTNAVNNMRAIGIDFLALASEHANDRGQEGINATHSHLDNVGIQYTGTSDTQEHRDTPDVVTINDIHIGIVSYTFASATDLESDFSVNTYISADDPKVQQLLGDVSAAKKVSDCVIVCIHWGDLYSTEVSSSQKELAQMLADAGVSVVIGNYPEVLQPAQWITGKNDNEMLCFYSLGNFISGDAGFEGADVTAQNLYQMGALAQFELVMNGQEVTVQNPRLYPIVNHFQDGFMDFRLVRLKDYTDDLSVLHDQADYSNSFSKTWLQDQLKDIYNKSEIPVEGM